MSSTLSRSASAELFELLNSTFNDTTALNNTTYSSYFNNNIDTISSNDVVSDSLIDSNNVPEEQYDDKLEDEDECCGLNTGARSPRYPFDEEYDYNELSQIPNDSNVPPSNINTVVNNVSDDTIPELEPAVKDELLDGTADLSQQHLLQLSQNSESNTFYKIGNLHSITENTDTVTIKSEPVERIKVEPIESPSVKTESIRVKSEPVDRFSVPAVRVSDTREITVKQEPGTGAAANNSTNTLSQKYDEPSDHSDTDIDTESHSEIHDSDVDTALQNLLHRRTAEPIDKITQITYINENNDEYPVSIIHRRSNHQPVQTLVPGANLGIIIETPGNKNRPFKNYTLGTELIKDKVYASNNPHAHGQVCNLLTVKGVKTFIKSKRIQEKEPHLLQWLKFVLLPQLRIVRTGTNHIITTSSTSSSSGSSSSSSSSSTNTGQRKSKTKKSKSSKRKRDDTGDDVDSSDSDDSDEDYVDKRRKPRRK